MTALHLPASGRDAIVADIFRHGCEGVETGSFLLVTRGSVDVAVVALLGDAGIRREPALLVIDATVIDHLFTYAEDRDLRVAAYLHSHGYDAFMSQTDQSGTIRTPGFIAGVIPQFTSPPPDPAAWSWWVCQAGSWHESVPAVVVDDRTARVLTVDSHQAQEL